MAGKSNLFRSARLALALLALGGAPLARAANSEMDHCRLSGAPLPLEGIEEWAGSEHLLNPPEAGGTVTLTTRPSDQRVHGHPNNDGARIEGASRLPSEGTGYRWRGYAPGRNFGTWELVELIQRASARFASGHEGSVIRVGDLSQRGGGEIRPHGSHRNGLDADIGYALDESGRTDPIASLELLRDFVEEIRAVPGARGIHTIYVGASVKRRFCQAAREAGRLEELAETLAHLEIHGGHTSHFHVRLNCPEGQSTCRLRQATPSASDHGC